LYKEQVQYFGTPDNKFRPLTYEELRELPLLDATIRETLRLHPPIHSIMRYVREDVSVPPSFAAPSKDDVYIVPKGNYVLASPLVSQMDPTIWKDSTKWDPYRWSDPEGAAARALKTYVDGNGEKIDFGFGAVSKGTESPYQPFGAGRHRCVGEQVGDVTNFAIMIVADLSRIVCLPSTRYRYRDAGQEDGNAHSNGCSGAQLSCKFMVSSPLSAYSYACFAMKTMITMPKNPRQIRYRRRNVE